MESNLAIAGNSLFASNSLNVLAPIIKLTFGWFVTNFLILIIDKSDFKLFSQIGLLKDVSGAIT